MFFDGGCRPNPGEMEAGLFAAGHFHHRANLGWGTSEEAEWLGLLLALEVAQALGLEELELLGDSRSVIDQANGRSRRRNPRFEAYRLHFLDQAGGFRRVRLRHIARTQNLAGIGLDRLRAGLPPFSAPPAIAARDGCCEEA